MTVSIFKDWIFDHAQYKCIFDNLGKEISRALDGGSPFVFPLLGDSRAGKSALLRDISERFANEVGAESHPKVLSVAMPTVASIEALATVIIHTLLGLIPVKGKPHQVLMQARDLLNRAGVKVLMVDELNHLIEKRSSEKAQTKEIRRTADWFKELGDQNNISIIIAGLTHVSRLYSENDQLQNRGLVGATIHPYEWAVTGDQKQFRDTIEAGTTHMIDHGWTIQIDLDLLTRVAYLGGGGYIGKARDLLVRIEEVGNKHKTLDRTLLAKAYTDKYSLNNLGNPLDLKEIDDLMLNRAHQQALQRATKSGRGR